MASILSARSALAATRYTRARPPRPPSMASQPVNLVILVNQVHPAPIAPPPKDADEVPDNKKRGGPCGPPRQWCACGVLYVKCLLQPNRPQGPIIGKTDRLLNRDHLTRSAAQSPYVSVPRLSSTWRIADHRIPVDKSFAFDAAAHRRIDGCPRHSPRPDAPGTSERPTRAGARGSQARPHRPPETTNVDAIDGVAARQSCHPCHSCPAHPSE